MTLRPMRFLVPVLATALLAACGGHGPTPTQVSTGGSGASSSATSATGSAGPGPAGERPSFAEVLSVARSSAALRGCKAIGVDDHPVGVVPRLAEWKDVSCTGSLGTNAVINWYRFTDAGSAARHLSELNLDISGAPYLISGSVVVQAAPDNAPSTGDSSAVAGLAGRIHAACGCGTVRTPAQ